MMKLTLWRVPMRSWLACSAAAVHDQITVRRMMKNITATVTPAKVRTVRSLFRPMLRTAIVTSPKDPSDSVGENALVQPVDGLGAFGRLVVVRDHDDGLVEFLIQLF